MDKIIETKKFVCSEEEKNELLKQGYEIISISCWEERPNGKMYIMDIKDKKDK